MGSDQEPAPSSGHTVTVPARTSTTTFPEPHTDRSRRARTRGQPRNIGPYLNLDAVTSVVQLRLEADHLLGQTRVEPQAVVAHGQTHVRALDDVHRAGHRAEMDALAGRPALDIGDIGLEAGHQVFPGPASGDSRRTQAWTTPDKVEPSDVREE